MLPRFSTRWPREGSFQWLSVVFVAQRSQWFTQCGWIDSTLPVRRLERRDELFQPLADDFLFSLKPLDHAFRVGGVLLGAARGGEICLQLFDSAAGIRGILLGAPGNGEVRFQLVVLAVEGLEPIQQLFDLAIQDVENLDLVHHSCLLRCGRRALWRAPPRADPFRDSLPPVRASSRKSGRLTGSWSSRLPGQRPAPRNGRGASATPGSRGRGRRRNARAFPTRAPAAARKRDRR